VIALFFISHRMAFLLYSFNANRFHTFAVKSGTRQSNLKEMQIMLNYLLGDGNGDIKQASRRNVSNRKKLEA